MYRRFRLWLHQFNPIALWLNERHLDREAKLEMVREMCDTLRAQAQVAQNAMQLSHRFLKSFEVTGDPNAYVVRNEDEVKSAAARYDIDLESFDGGDNPFTFVS